MELESSDRPLAEPAEHLQVARQICVLRVRNFDEEVFERAAALKEQPDVDLNEVRLLLALKGRTNADGRRFNWVSGPAKVVALVQTNAPGDGKGAPGRAPG